MGWGIKLTDAEWDALDRMRFSTSSADVFRNCLIILLSDSRDTIASIAGRLPSLVTTMVPLVAVGSIAPLKEVRFSNLAVRPSLQPQRMGWRRSAAGD